MKVEGSSLAVKHRIRVMGHKTSIRDERGSRESTSTAHALEQLLWSGSLSLSSTLILLEKVEGRKLYFADFLAAKVLYQIQVL